MWRHDVDECPQLNPAKNVGEFLACLRVRAGAYRFRHMGRFQGSISDVGSGHRVLIPCASDRASLLSAVHSTARLGALHMTPLDIAEL